MTDHDPRSGALLEELPAGSDAEPTGISGTLRELQLPELLQHLAHNRKDARVELRVKDGDDGLLYVEQGELVFAVCGALVGEPAVFALLPANRGSFRVRYGRKASAHNVHQPLAFLLLEGARHFDEGARTQVAEGAVRPGPDDDDEVGWGSVLRTDHHAVFEPFDTSSSLDQPAVSLESVDSIDAVAPLEGFPGIDDLRDFDDFDDRDDRDDFDDRDDLDALDALEDELEKLEQLEKPRSEEAGPFGKFFDEAGVHAPPDSAEPPPDVIEPGPRPASQRVRLRRGETTQTERPSAWSRRDRKRS